MHYYLEWNPDKDEEKLLLIRFGPGKVSDLYDRRRKCWIEDFLKIGKMFTGSLDVDPITEEEAYRIITGYSSADKG